MPPLELYMFGIPALVVSAAVTALAASSSLASDAVVSQVPSDVRILCTDCAAKEPEQAPVLFADAVGPADTHHIVQVGNDNVAIGLSYGQGNYIGQFQFGHGNHSAVGLIADDSSVTVVQNGDHLESNLLVWGNPGSPIGVYQPHGSPPVNAAIFTAADGTQAIFPGNATVVIAR